MDDFLRGLLAGAIPLALPLAYAVHLIHRLADQVRARDVLLKQMRDGWVR